METLNETLNIFLERKDPNLSRTCDLSGGVGYFTSSPIMQSAAPFEDHLDAFITIPQYELFGDYNILACPSIHSDVEKYETNNSLLDGLVSDNRDIKPEIRNSDCMWSSGSTSSILSTSASSSFSDNVTIANAVPLAVVTGNTQNIINNTKTQLQQQQQQQQPTIVVANNRKFHVPHINIKQEIKTEPNDDYEQQLQQHSIRKTAQQQQQTRSSMQHIPPGTSLLRKSNTQQQRKLQQQQKSLADDSSHAIQQRNRYLSINAVSNINVTTNSNPEMRPDTPHSLNADNTEFKHSVDLRACVMGSNNISLNDTEANILIQQYTQELQDTSKRVINTRLIQRGNSLSEVLDVIDKDSNSSHCNRSLFTKCSSSSSFSSSTPSTKEAMKLSSTHQQPTSEFETDDDEDDVDSICGSAISYGSVTLSSQTSTTSGISSSSSMNSGHHHKFQQTYMTHHSDHSYTRCKDGMEEMRPNLETPSDSDEEIDVVSVGDKKLPTNPSDKDRLKFQTKVAHKLSNEHIVKTPNGIRTIPPQRRASSISNATYTLPYTPASSSPVKSLNSSRYPSPASTPMPTHKYARGPPPLVINSDGTTTTAPSKIKLVAGDKRKRVVSDIDNVVAPANKKGRGKKPTAKQINAAITATAVVPVPAAATPAISNSSQKRHYSLDEAAAETIEKRNLHNDMERQRRIGLKNLFDGLKKQIPSIRDKERAPKVNILREAAKLCHSLNHEEQYVSEQKALMLEELKKKQEIVAALRAAAQRN